MFDTEKIFSAANGRLLPLEEVKDEVFSEKMVGDGYAVVEYSGVVYAPAGGVIKSIFSSKHAFTIETMKAKTLLIHMGINTVVLNGEPFKFFVNEGDVVEKGQMLASIDINFLKSREIDDTLLVLAPEHRITKVYQQKGFVQLADKIMLIK